MHGTYAVFSFVLSGAVIDEENATLLCDTGQNVLGLCKENKRLRKGMKIY